ncbi:MAG: DNA replication/repair protein RecF [Peptococcaceae bacterium]|jgi:DNA replication and repair protein RecF|nr:DNA replication/repair protein RecF [Peptococcaceae bacterium]
MRLITLAMTNFRNYRRQSCHFAPGLNLLEGANAQGKTNLIEGVYYLSIGRAYRAARDEQLARWESEGFQLQATIEGKNGKTGVSVDYRKSEKAAKKIFVGGLRLEKIEELSGVLTSVLFSPDSMAVIKGGPQERRNFLDYDIAQISLAYSRNSQKYRRVLAQRNALLKKIGLSPMGKKEKEDRLSLWDQQLIDYGTRIIARRQTAVDKLTPLTRLAHRKLTEGKENIEIKYRVSTKDKGGWDGRGKSDEEIKAVLSQDREDFLAEDLRWGSTQWGPQRDDLEISLNGVDLRQFGSQGQQRTGVLALKLAELEFFRGESGEYPILLLDDVMSELDKKRQERLLGFIDEKGIQCLITATEAKDIFSGRKDGLKRFVVKEGSVAEG